MGDNFYFFVFSTQRCPINVAAVYIYMLQYIFAELLYMERSGLVAQLIQRGDEKGLRVDIHSFFDIPVFHVHTM